MIKPYKQREDEIINKNPVPVIKEIDQDKSKVSRILKDKKERINGKDVRLYLVRYKGESAEKDEWLKESEIPEGPILLRNYKANKRNQH